MTTSNQTPVQMLVINDLEYHQGLWVQGCENRKWASHTVPSLKSKDIVDSVTALLDQSGKTFDGTILDVMLFHEEHGGLRAFEELVRSFDRETFGQLVIATGKEGGDAQVNSFVDDPSNGVLAWCESPLSASSREKVFAKLEDVFLRQGRILL